MVCLWSVQYCRSSIDTRFPSWRILFDVGQEQNCSGTLQPFFNLELRFYLPKIRGQGPLGCQGRIHLRFSIVLIEITPDIVVDEAGVSMHLNASTARGCGNLETLS